MEKNKIYFRLDGGLGNQLSEYAASKYIENKLSCTIYYDLYYLTKSKKKHEKLTLENLYKNKTIVACWKSKVSRTINRALYKLKIKPVVIFGFIFYFENYPSKLEKNIIYILEGFWQDKKYYSNGVTKAIYIELKKIINFEKEEIVNISEKINQRSLAVHVRRGDFLTNRNYFIRQQFALSNNYYIKSISDYLDDIDDIYIFADDNINYHEILPKLRNWHNIFFMKNYKLTDLESFYLISRFNKIIIANSTFSLWAAIISKLCSNDNATVIAPCKWHKNKPYDLDIIPNNFIISKEF